MLAMRPSTISASSPPSSNTRLNTSERGSRTELRDRILQKSFFGVDPLPVSDVDCIESVMNWTYLQLKDAPNSIDAYKD
jgi:hypothetical protein